MVPHRQPRRFLNTGPGPRRRPWYRAASVPVHRQSGGNQWLRLSRQLRTVQTVQFWEYGWNCSDKFQLFLTRCERPCDPAAKTFLGARCSARQWIHVLRQQGRLLEEILVFYVNRYTRLLRSTLVLLFSFLVWKWPRSSSTPAVACFLLVLLVLMHLVLCSRRLPSSRMEKCAQFLLRPTIFLGNLYIISTNTLFCCIFSCAQSPPVIFWEPSTTKSSSLSRARGWRGRRESDSQVTCHQLVSVTAFCIDRCGVTIHTHQVVSQTTTTTTTTTTTAAAAATTTTTTPPVIVQRQARSLRGNVVDISVVAQRQFPLVLCRKPLRFSSCSSLTRWSISVVQVQQILRCCL